MAQLLKIARFLDSLAEGTGRAVAWLALALTALTVYDVVARYAFQSGSVALQEAEWHIFAVLFLLAAAYTLKHDAHVRVDILYGRLGPRGKGIVDLLGTLLLLLPFCLLMIGTSWEFVSLSWEMGESSSDPGGLPYRWLLKGMIPLGFLLVALQGVAQAIHALRAVVTGAEDPDGAKEPNVV
ncbi:MAG: TRAP transporter small permease subunit [Nitrospinae bacterium]|nr:TRAP transporter small permease subunit [Nitrospinota bacterium]